MQPSPKLSPKKVPAVLSSPLKAGLNSAVHVVAATSVYRYLISGGWLTNHYQLNDPNIVNLVLAIFEPIAIVSVIAYWLWRKPFLYRLISILCFVQILIGVGFAAFILFFAFTWHPKMM
jgi:hypothetical protein